MRTCIINKTKVIIACLDPLVLFLPKHLKLFGSIIFRYLANLMKVIPETRRADYI